MKRTGSLSLLLMTVTLLMMLLSVTLAVAQTSPAQTKEEFREVINKRAAKIVAALQSTDSVFNNKVTNIVADQYMALSAIHDARNAKIKDIKAKGAGLTEKDKAAIEKLQARSEKDLAKLHKAYLKKLSAHCTSQQIDEIKNGMTYNVLNVTYSAYKDMIPSLTEEQKAQILSWLTEAREKAMDAESSEKKHAVFGKYKGRINNYLAKAGIDMKKEEKAWQQRLKEKREAAKQSK